MITIRRLPLVAAMALVGRTAGAQENYEIQVYPSATAAPHTTLFELHSNWTGSGSRTHTGPVLPSNHALQETLEITPDLEWPLKGPDAGRGSTGTLTRMAPVRSQQHMLDPTLDFRDPPSACGATLDEAAVAAVRPRLS